MNTLLKLLMPGIFICLFSFNAQAQFSFGGGLRFNNNNVYHAIGLMGKATFGLNANLNIHANATYYFSDDASWSFDGDIHYKLLDVNDGAFIINPFAGLNFTRTSTTNNSLSLGLFLKYQTEKLGYFLEPRWILDDNQFVISVGVLF